MKTTAWILSLFSLFCATAMVCTAKPVGYLTSDYDDYNMLQNDYLLEKRNKPSLSIVNPLDVLRQRLLLEIARRQMKENTRQVELNRAILKNVGKRDPQDAHHFPLTLYPEYPIQVFQPRTDKQLFEYDSSSRVSRPSQFFYSSAENVPQAEATYDLNNLDNDMEKKSLDLAKSEPNNKDTTTFLIEAHKKPACPDCEPIKSIRSAKADDNNAAYHLRYLLQMHKNHLGNQ